MHPKLTKEIIADRLSARRHGYNLSDGAKLGLAVEGGAMKGIVSAGMLVVLQDLGVLDVFDCYTGTSAGGLNLAYVLAGQASTLMSVYCDDMSDHENLRLIRTHRGNRKIMNIRRMYLQAFTQKPLNEAYLRRHYAKSLRIGASNVTTKQGELISLNQAGNRFFEYLMAGATMPYVAGEPCRLITRNTTTAVCFIPARSNVQKNWAAPMYLYSTLTPKIMKKNRGAQLLNTCSSGWMKHTRTLVRTILKPYANIVCLPTNCLGVKLLSTICACTVWPSKPAPASNV